MYYTLLQPEDINKVPTLCHPLQTDVVNMSAGGKDLESGCWWGMAFRIQDQDGWQRQSSDTRRTNQASCCIPSRRRNGFKNVSRFVQVRDKGLAGEVGKCLISWSYCGQAPPVLQQQLCTHTVSYTEGLNEDSYTMYLPVNGTVNLWIQKNMI